MELFSSIDPSKPGDLKECFNVASLRECVGLCNNTSLLSQHTCVSPVQRYPDDEVPTMQPRVQEFFQTCSQLALKVLGLMGHALKQNVSQSVQSECA